MKSGETAISEKRHKPVPLVEKLGLCPGCQVPIEKSVELFPIDILGVTSTVCRCGSCGLVFKSSTLTESGLKKVYAVDYVHFENSNQGVEDRISTERRLAKILKSMSIPRNRAARLLDVGCGSGGVVSTALDLGIDAHGIDPFLPAHLESNRLTHQSIFDLKTEEWDIITAFNVIEHLVNPQAFFIELNRLLKPGGAVLFTCPWGDSIHRRLYRSSWAQLALEEHLLFWTPDALRTALATAGIYGAAQKTICGAPFPIGYRKKASVDIGDQNEENKPLSKTILTSAGKSSIRDSVSVLPMRMMRIAQRNKTFSAVLRLAIDVFHIGCYLEFILIKSDHEN